MSSGGAGGVRPPLARRVRLLYAANRHFTPRRLLNLALVRIERKLGRTRLLSRPYQLCIDVGNTCNLACPFCPTGRREVGRRKGNIGYDTFTQIVDELAPYAFTLELFNWGEAFFNPELPRLIAYAHRKRLVTLLCSNLSFRLTDDFVRAVIRAGLTHLGASVDGADQQSYEVYRRGGNFDLVMENLRRFVRIKRELGSAFPRISWNYLIFAHNEDRVEDARRRAQELGLDGFAATGGLYEDPSWAPKGQYSYAYLNMHPNRCPWLWGKAVFHWDGGMASCCNGFFKHDDFADWKPGSFARMWNNDKFIAARRIWTDPTSPLPADHFCTHCEKVRLYRGLSRPARTEAPPARRAESAVEGAGGLG